MTANLTINEEVKVLTPNFVDSYSDITSSHGGTTSYLYDMDNCTKFKLTSPGGNRDTKEATLEIIFKVGSTETEFLMNCFMLFRCNIREMGFDYWSGSNWVNLTTVSENTDDYIIRFFGEITTSRVRFRMKKTIDPNQFKEITKLIVARHRFNFPSYSVLNEVGREKVATLILGDGSEHRAVTKFTPNRSMKYGANLTFEYLTRQEYENLRALKDENSPFLWMPESVYWPEEIYYVNWINPPPVNYSTKKKPNGYTLQMELHEV